MICEGVHNNRLFALSKSACLYNQTLLPTFFLRGGDKNRSRRSELWSEPSRGGSVVQDDNIEGSERKARSKRVSVEMVDLVGSETT